MNAPNDSTRFFPLNPAERQMLVDRLGSIIGMLEAANIQHDAGNAPELCDLLMTWWRGQPEASRPDANDVVWAVGLLLGEFFRSNLRAQWRVVEDHEGTDIGLVLLEGERNIVLLPVNSIAKRFENATETCAREYFAGVLEALENVGCLGAVLRDEGEEVPPLEDDAE